MKQQSKALRLLFYHLRQTFLVSTQPVAFVKVLVGLLVGGCSVIHLSPVCECCIKRTSKNIAVSHNSAQAIFSQDLHHPSDLL